MTTPSSARGPAAAIGETISLTAIMACTSNDELKALGDKIKLKYPVGVNTVATRQMLLIREAQSRGLLYESQCAQVVEKNPELQSELRQVQLAVHDAQQAAAEAVGMAKEAKVTAAGLQEEVAGLVREVQLLKSLVQGQQERQKEEALDAPKQQELACAQGACLLW